MQNKINFIAQVFLQVIIEMNTYQFETEMAIKMMIVEVAYQR